MPINSASSLSLLLFLSLASSLPLPSLTASTSKAQDGGGSGTLQLWCVAKNNAEDAPLLTALQWACGPGAADCRPIQQGGACYDSGDVQKMASYAFNDYYLKHGTTDDSCNFNNNAALTSLDPSYGKCKFPSSVAVNNGSLSGSPTVTGLGPSADLNSCSKMPRRWFLTIVIAHLFLVISQGIRGL